MVLTIISFDKLGSELRKIRKAKGVTQEQMAEAIGFSVTHIIATEKDKVPIRQDFIVKYCERLNISINAIVTLNHEDLDRLVSLANDVK